MEKLVAILLAVLVALAFIVSMSAIITFLIYELAKVCGIGWAYKKIFFFVTIILTVGLIMGGTDND